LKAAKLVGLRAEGMETPSQSGLAP